MAFKWYHGKTGVVWNVTKRAVGVEVNKTVSVWWPTRLQLGSGGAMGGGQTAGQWGIGGTLGPWLVGR